MVDLARAVLSSAEGLGLLDTGHSHELNDYRGMWRYIRIYINQASHDERIKYVPAQRSHAQLEAEDECETRVKCSMALQQHRGCIGDFGHVEERGTHRRHGCHCGCLSDSTACRSDSWPLTSAVATLCRHNGIQSS
jgi:hypothetical protein